MKLHEEEIRLDPDSDGVNFEPSDWLVCTKHFGLMHYLPTGAQYFVDLPKEAYAKEQAFLMDFCAWLVNVCEEIPTPEELLEQGRAAIAVFLIENGFWNPTIVEIPDKPKPCRKPVRSNRLTH
jgi:hypothetical protein